MHATKPTKSPRAPDGTPRAWVAVLALAILLTVAWGPGLSAPFILDDHASVLDNSSIRHLWPPDWIHPPATGGETVSGRPLLNFTFALNWALASDGVVTYRLTNLLIHAAAALLLMGVIRRTRADSSSAATSGWLPLAIALLWAVHPLQTGAVTYVVQRAESLAAMFLLLTLYAFIRAVGSPAGAARWMCASVAACALGMATKETVVVAPVLVLLYDRAFVAGSFRAAWHARGRWHLAFAATWLVLAALVLANPGRGGSAGWATTISPWTYALTQAGAVVRYLGLAFWPAGLVFDHGTPVVTDPVRVVPQLLLLAALIGATIWALIRNRPSGFLGAAFLLALAPSSSVIPVATQTVAEHRMYLALAPVILAATSACAVAARQRRASALALAVPACAIAALTLTTRARNEVFQSEERLWRDTVAKAPDNPRAHYNLGLTLAIQGRTDEAAAHFQRTLELRSNHAFAHFELGKAALQAERWADAAARFENALQADAGFVDARVNLAKALVNLERHDEAIAHYRAALASQPGAPDIAVSLASVLIQRGELAEATVLLEEAIARAPELAEGHFQLGVALARAREHERAASAFRRAVRLKPGWAEAHRALAVALVARGDLAGAELSCRESLRLDDRAVDAWFVLGSILAQQRRFPDAMTSFQRALALDADHVPALNNLANCQLVTGRLDDAIATYEAVLRLRPEDASVRDNLRLARELKASRGVRD